MTLQFFARYVVQHQNDTPFLLNSIKFNLFGELIGLNMGGTRSFINVILMLWEVIHCSMR